MIPPNYSMKEGTFGAEENGESLKGLRSIVYFSIHILLCPSGISPMMWEI